MSTTCSKMGKSGQKTIKIVLFSKLGKWYDTKITDSITYEFWFNVVKKRSVSQKLKPFKKRVHELKYFEK
jgi:hypothetical protein